MFNSLITNLSSLGSRRFREPAHAAPWKNGAALFPKRSRGSFGTFLAREKEPDLGASSRLFFAKNWERSRSFGSFGSRLSRLEAGNKTNHDYVQFTDNKFIDFDGEELSTLEFSRSLCCLQLQFCMGEKKRAGSQKALKRAKIRVWEPGAGSRLFFAKNWERSRSFGSFGSRSTAPQACLIPTIVVYFKASKHQN